MGSSSDGRFGSTHQASSHQTTNLLQVLSEFVRNYVELSSVRESSRHVCFQLLQCNQMKSRISFVAMLPTAPPIPDA